MGAVDRPKPMRIIGGRDLDEAPTFTASIGEKVTIKRFLDFALADLKCQFQRMNNDATVPRSELHDAQATAVLFSNYIETLKAGVEQMTLEQAH